MKTINKQTIIRYFSELLFIILFITAMTRLFGQQEALTAVASVTAILIFNYFPLDELVFRKELSLASLGFFSFGLLATLNLVVGPFLACLINLISLGLIMCLYGKQFSYKLYVPYILLYIFAATSDPLGFNLPKRLVSLCISAGLIALVYSRKHRKKQLTTKLNDSGTFTSLPTSVIQSALTMAIGISLTLLASQLLQFEKPLWICMTIMSLTQLETRIFNERLIGRISGSIIGIYVHTILLVMLVPNSLHLALTLSLSYIYTFISNYFWQVVFITVNVFFAASALWQLDIAIVTRVFFVIIGSLIVLILNHVLTSLLVKNSAKGY